MTDVDEIFRDYHSYRRAVRRGFVQALTHECGREMVSGYGDDDDFVLNCYHCNVETSPGLNTLDQIKAVAEEYFG